MGKKDRSKKRREGRKRVRARLKEGRPSGHGPDALSAAAAAAASAAVTAVLALQRQRSHKDPTMNNVKVASVSAVVIRLSCLSPSVIL